LAEINPLQDPANFLVGMDLPGGWMVVSKVERPEGATGGNFCIGYVVENLDGRRGFCKALNLARALTAPNPAQLLEQLTHAYNYECELLAKCAATRMSRVVLAIDKGVIDVPGFALPKVNYIIFEWAEGDVRAALNASEGLDIAARLRCLHNVAIGLRQLHANLIAHQDLKPSNVLMFAPDPLYPDGVSKIGDLGRATDHNRPARPDNLMIAGDRTYAPPEQLYRATPLDFGPRRLACDLYQLGELIVFLFTASSLNALLHEELHPSHAWENWGGTYADALPYVRDAYGRVLARLAADMPKPISDDLIHMVSYLCDPDPDRRGHPQELSGGRNSYSLQRVISHLDLMAKRAEIHLKGVLP
jgi:serine/threonine protein kinase